MTVLLPKTAPINFPMVATVHHTYEMMFVQHYLQIYISLIYGWVCRVQYKNRDIRTLPLSFQRMFPFFLVFFLHYKSNLKSKIDLKMLEFEELIQFKSSEYTSRLLIQDP